MGRKNHRMLPRTFSPVGPKTHQPPDADAHHATDTMQGNLLAEEAFYQHPLLLSNDAVYRIQDKLPAAGLALMVRLARMRMAILR